MLAATQRHRVADGDGLAEAHHLEAALDELGLDADPIELADARTGAGLG